MLKSSLIIYLSLFVIMSSCSVDQKEDTVHGVLPGDVSVSSCFSLLPDFTFNYQNQSGFSKSFVEGKAYLTSLSSGEIFTFETEKGVLVSKVKIEKEGPLAIGSSSSSDGVFFVNSDSILYSSNAQNKIFLLTSDTVVTVVDFSKTSNVRLASTFQNAPVEGKDHILFPIYPNTKEDIGKGFAFVAIAKDISSYDQVISFVPAYGDKFFGTTPYFYWPSVAYNDKTESYVVSFPVDHRLFEYDADFNLTEIHVINHDVMGSIEQYPYALDENGNPNWQEDRAYYREASLFYNIYYLGGSNLYFRLGKIIDPENESRQLCAFIYDSTFSKSKTLILSSDYTAGSIFALDESIYLLNEARLTSERTVELPYDCLSFEAD